MTRPLRGAAKANAAKTHCKRGHEFTPENTRWFYQNGKANGGRACRECDRLHNRRQWKRRRDIVNHKKRERRREERLRKEGVQ